MKYLLRDRESGLFVGSHSHKHAQLQEREYAYVFSTQKEVEESYNLLAGVAVDLEIVIEGI